MIISPCLSSVFFSLGRTDAFHDSPNGGVFSSLFGTPMINLPQAAVLGMHAIKDKLAVVNGQNVVRPIMVVALIYDHRLMDVREAVTFLG